MRTTADYHPLAILIAILLISSICICPVAAQTQTDRVTIQSDSPSDEITIPNFTLKVNNYTPYQLFHRQTICPILLESACDDNNWNNYRVPMKDKYHMCLDSDINIFKRAIIHQFQNTERVHNEKCSDMKCHFGAAGHSENALQGTLRVSYDNNVKYHEFVVKIIFTPELLTTQRDGKYITQFMIYPEDRYESTILNLKIDLNHPTKDEIDFANSIARMIDRYENLENLGILINEAPQEHMIAPYPLFIPEPMPIVSECLTIPLTGDRIIQPYFVDNALVGPATPEMRAQIKTSAALKTQINNEISEYNNRFIRK